MITAAQLRAARALVSISQRKLAELSGLSVPTIQRMEASQDVIRGNVDSLMKLVGALDAVGVELIGEGAVSHAGGRGLRLKAQGANGQADRRTSPPIAIPRAV
jgi:transcriptional regulator with XRE-family HTH domain